MQLDKNTSKQEKPINFYDELFAKKSSEESVEVENQPENKEEKIEKEQLAEKGVILDNFEKLSLKKKFTNAWKENHFKYILTGILMGVIVNISVSHYQAMDLQHTSQKFATGLIYNLSETNNLEQIAQNIYLGMKDNGWEPKIKLSNANIFVFELDNGGQFTITKSQDISSTKFHIEVSEFSNTMIKALMIQLEPTKIGGTKNFITNKKYDSARNTISFDIEKLGQAILVPPFDTSLNMPSAIPDYSPLEKKENELLLPPLATVPISPELQGVLNQENKNLDDNSTIKQIK